MLIWSRYNLLFTSKRLGLMLYNGLSNRVMPIAPEHAAAMESIRNSPEEHDFSGMLPLFLQLLHSKALLSENEEQQLLRTLSKRRIAWRDDTSRLALTILPTEDCDFGCPYCYEKNKRPVSMSSRTMDRLEAFVAEHLPLKRLTVTWFGGEPLLRPDIMHDLTARFTALDLKYEAHITTNGWGLNEECTAGLGELRVRSIQVTIDGPPRIHNLRRFHKQHGPTHAILQANLDRLMLKENWPGMLRVNVVIDKDNAPYFAETYQYWNNRYPGRVVVGPTMRDSTARGLPLSRCAMNRTQEADFLLEQYRKGAGRGGKGLPGVMGEMCLAACRNAYIIGAEGQVYKCLDDIGLRDREAGSLHEDRSKWNSALENRYLAMADPAEDETCRDCFHLPVCSPCPNVRYRAAYDGQDISPCLALKDRLPEILEAQYELMLARNNSSDAR